MNKFPNNTIYNHEFEKVKNAIFYPYVGEEFKEANKRVMIFAYNIPVNEEKYVKEKYKRENPTHFADSLDDYTYEKAFWTTTWRNFIKGSLSLKSNFSRNSDSIIKNKIDDFVKSISHINFINDLVISNTNNNANVPDELIQKSIKINQSFLKILDVTHCVAWGKNVFNLMKKMPDFEVISNHKVNKKGFGKMVIKNQTTNQEIKVLKVYHPSMPGFGIYSEETHKILDDFLIK